MSFCKLPEHIQPVQTKSFKLSNLTKKKKKKLDHVFVYIYI